ncbi:unnamed protein product, partial [marine sediment metagenome]
IKGRGDEDFMAVLWNMKVIAKVNGDSYSIVKRTKEGDVLNILPISPEHMRVTFNKQGRITKYTDKRTKKDYKPQEILHFSNDRVADEMGGTSVIATVQWALDARNEAMRDWRRISHISTVRILYVDEDDKPRLAALKTEYAAAINKGEVLIITGAPKDAGFQDLVLPNAEAFLAWIRYLENFIYIAIGIPKVIMLVKTVMPVVGSTPFLTAASIFSPSSTTPCIVFLIVFISPPLKSIAAPTPIAAPASLVKPPKPEPNFALMLAPRPAPAD